MNGLSFCNSVGIGDVSMSTHLPILPILHTLPFLGLLCPVLFCLFLTPQLLTIWSSCSMDISLSQLNFIDSLPKYGQNYREKINILTEKSETRVDEIKKSLEKPIVCK